jgi:hypothetical protein
MALRPELQKVVEALLAAAPLGTGEARVTLDQLGDALGAMTVSQDDIDDVMRAVERAGRRIVGPEGANNEAMLGVVLGVARALRTETGKVPTATQIAARAGVDEARVRHALALARVIAR